jgi:hypothetical protein
MILGVSYGINQSLADDTKTVTLTEVKFNLNRGYQKVANKVNSLGQDFYLRTAKTNLVDSQSLYGLPSDFRKFSAVEIGYSSSSNREKAVRVDRNAVEPDYQFTQGTPVYALTGNMFEIFPTPTATVTDGILLRYTEGVTDMVNTTDVPNLPEMYLDLPIEYAIAKAKLRQGLVDEHRELMNEFYKELDDMQEEWVSRNEDDNEKVIIRDEY